jgi:hypothetical protein
MKNQTKTAKNLRSRAMQNSSAGQANKALLRVKIQTPAVFGKY